MAFSSGFKDPGLDPVYRHPPGEVDSGPTLQQSQPAQPLVQPTKSESASTPGGLLGAAAKIGGSSTTPAAGGDSLGGGDPTSSMG